jgi:hypothetical protein
MKQLGSASLAGIAFGNSDAGGDGDDSYAQTPSMPQTGGTGVIGQQCVYVGAQTCYVADCYGSNKDPYAPGGGGASGGRLVDAGRGNSGVLQAYYWEQNGSNI